MRKLLGDILIFLLCIVLVINFGRFFFVPSNGEYVPLDAFSVLDAISAVDVDATPLYNAAADALGVVGAIGLRVASAFNFDFSSGTLAIQTIVNILTAGFDIIYNSGVVFAYVGVLVYQFILYFIKLFNALITLINTLFGSIFRTAHIQTLSGFISSNGNSAFDGIFGRPSDWIY